MKIAKTRKIAQNPRMKEKREREREKKKNLTISLKYATNVN